ncbi:MAG: cellulose biosynthesis protein BcsS [Porticoccaceae bacterium]
MARIKIQHVARGAILAASCAMAMIGHAQDGTVLFGGVDGREKSFYSYLGIIDHLNGDIASDGILLRAFGSYGEYDYRSAAVAGGKVNADVATFDAMIGYQKGVDNLLLRGYAGLDYEDHDLSPNNPYDSNRGSDVGVKVQGEVETGYASEYYANVIGSYGTAKDRYWVRLRGGYNFDGYVVGPEALLTGTHESDEQRIGAFMTLTNFGRVGLSVSTGYSDTSDRRGGSSLYGTLELSTRF